MITEYQTQNMLNPKLWVADELKPGLLAKFMKIADYFYDTLETDTDVYDVVLIGSNANYNWTEYSDIDLHVIINYLQVGDNLHLVDKYLRSNLSISYAYGSAFCLIKSSSMVTKSADGLRIHSPRIIEYIPTDECKSSLES